jgi:membrane fusion protein (multidrug efflux system)
MAGPDTLDPTSEDEEQAAGRAPSALDSIGVRRGLAAIVLLALIGVLVLIFNWWTVGRFAQSTNDAFLQADQVTVAPKTAGYVEQVLVADNQAVAPGQALVRIDARDSMAKVAQAHAQVEQWRAAAGQAVAQIHQQQAQIAQAQTQLSAARASADYAAREVTRYSPLAQSGAETNEHLDQLRQNRAQADAQAQASAAQVLAAQRQIDTLRAQIKVAQAQADQSEALVRQNSQDVDLALVRASIAGRIGDRTVRAGQYVQPGTRLMSVVPVQALYVTANFKETQIGRMRPGQPVTIKVDALGDRKLKGVLESFAPGTGAQFALIPPSNATGNFTKIVQRVAARIRIEAPEDVRAVLLPGLSVSVVVDTRKLNPEPQP